MTALNVTMPVVPMSNALAPTVAGDVAERVRLSHSETVVILNEWRLGYRERG
jgi:hypothetical protein